MAKNKLSFFVLFAVFGMCACNPISGGDSSESPSSSEEPSSSDPSSSSEEPVVKPIYYHYPASEATCTRFANYECWIKESNGTVVTGTAPRNATIVEADPLALEDNEFKEYYKSPALGHSWSTWSDKPGEEATCWQAGKEIRECFVCHLEEERGKQVNHNFNDVVTEPTCTTGGYTTHTCTECGYEVVDTITSPTGHSLSPVNYEPATCTEDGHVAHYHCTACHKNYEDNAATIEIDDVTLPQLGHTWANQSYSWNSDYTICYATATCTHNPEHILNDQAARASYSEEGGVTTYVSSAFSQSAVFEVQTIHVYDHVHIYDSEVTPATCGHDGCTDPDCDYFEVVVDEGSALSHSMHHHAAVPQTCTTDGYIEYYECETVGGCRLKYTDSQGINPVTNVILEKYGHNYVEEVTGPTCTEEGYTTHTCTRCGDYYEDTRVPKTVHQWSEWADDPDNRATCTEAGKEIRECSVCHEVQSRDKIATGHNIQFDHFEWADNNTTAKAVYICANGCGTTEKYVAEMSCEQITAPTCSTAGTGDYTASYDDHHDTKQGPIAIDPNAHDYESLGTYAWNSGKTEAKENYQCSYNHAHTKQETVYIQASTPLYNSENIRSELASNMAAGYRQGGKYGDINIFYKYKNDVTDAQREFNVDVNLRLTRSTAISDMKDLFIIRVDNSFRYSGSAGSGGSYGIMYSDLSIEDKDDKPSKGSVDNKYDVTNVSDNRDKYTSAVVDDFETDYRNFTKDVAIKINAHLVLSEKKIIVTVMYFPKEDTYSGYLGYTQTFTVDYSKDASFNAINSIKITRVRESNDSISTNMVIDSIVSNNGVLDADVLATTYSGDGWFGENFADDIILSKNA